MDPLWLAIHFVDLALHSRLQQQQPGFYALVEGHPPTLTQVNGAARQQGVKPSMNIATATALCAELTLLSLENEANQNLERLAQWAYAFSGKVVVVEPDLLLLEGRSMLKLFGGLVPWLQAIEASASSLALPYGLGVGRTPLMATLFARQGRQCAVSLGEFESKQDERQRLNQLSLHELALPGEAAQRLQNMGITQFSQLSALPRHELGQRFGSELLLYLQRLLGEVADIRKEFQPPSEFCHKQVLLEEVAHTQGLLFPLKRMLGLLATFLRYRQLACEQFSIFLKHRQGEDTELIIRPAFAQGRADELLKLVQLRFERLTLFQPVIEVSVVSGHHNSLAVTSGALSSDGQSWVDSQLPQLQLLGQFKARLGNDRVGMVSCVDAIRPEKAWRWSELEGNSDGGCTKPRPPWLLPEPVAVERRRLSLRHGPERLESDWWHVEPLARDYYLAQLDGHRWCWVYRDLQGWYIHGWF
ncbi:Y-family DNA polymerase [Ferrimonas aestuarii]|uniref:DNA polymerase Y family protein n=1 Tax=Ferrimonas aestuarii TaxID=2569539 RepID=A0A4U1BP50_9GAMM|nr:DNA polymerase Y family protein [Ferrimonas aestuarii]TKB54236.1 DNA polymerase Y family protein [Ferrimonas aestuarii]